VAYEPSDAEDEMPALLAHPESDVEDEMSENEFEMPDLLYRKESSESEDEIHAQKPARKRVFRRTKQQRKKTRQQERDDSSDSEMEEYDSDGMPCLRRDHDNNETSKWNKKWPGLNPPELKTGERIGGSNKRQLRRENKAKRIEKQEGQEETTYWSSYKGEFVLPEKKEGLKKWVGEMCPSNLAIHHPAAVTLLKHASGGCPANTGRPWTKEEMQAAIDRGPHVSALDPEAIEQLQQEVQDKVKKGQARLVLWDEIKKDPPKELKISPIAMIPHKSRKFRAILDLSFRLCHQSMKALLWRHRQVQLISWATRCRA
jgi:hypothetical protein